MKVKQQFFCTQEQKTYLVGDEYTGNRKDLSHMLENYEDKSLTPKRKTKNRR